MIKQLTTGICVLTFTSSLAFAQASQGQAGAATGPTSVNAQNTPSSDPMNSNAKMKKKMKKSMMKKDDGMMKSDGMAKDGMMKKDGMAK